jgi:hypothetical protein
VPDLEPIEPSERSIGVSLKAYRQEEYDTGSLSVLPTAGGLDRNTQMQPKHPDALTHNYAQPYEQQPHGTKRSVPSDAMIQSVPKRNRIDAKYSEEQTKVLLMNMQEISTALGVGSQELKVSTILASIRSVLLIY